MAKALGVLPAPPTTRLPTQTTGTETRNGLALAHRDLAAMAKAQLMGTRAVDRKLGRSQNDGARVLPRTPPHQDRHSFTRFGWAALVRVLLEGGRSADPRGR